MGQRNTHTGLESWAAEGPLTAQLAVPRCAVAVNMSGASCG
jgi:hypothetical protein